jgi:hypothetical protein
MLFPPPSLLFFLPLTMDQTGFLLELLEFVSHIESFRSFFTISLMLENAALLDLLIAIPAFKQPDACAFTK